MKSIPNAILKIFFISIFIFFVLYLFIDENICTYLLPINILESKIALILKIFTSLFACFAPALFFLYFKKTKENKVLWSLLFLFSCFYYFILFFLLIYLKITWQFFDFDFLKYNLNEALFTVFSVIDKKTIFNGLILFGFFIISFFTYARYLTIKNNSHKKTLKYLLCGLLFLFIVSVAVQSYFKYQKCLFADFLSSFYVEKNPIYLQYKKDYLKTTENYLNFNQKYLNQTENSSLPDIYFIHLESINGSLINQGIIPNFEKYAAENGVFFNNFYSNSIQTLRAQESILCALPPSLKSGYFKDVFNSQKLTCIPKILAQTGYQTLFFKSHDLKFSETGQFMTDIGFQEIHNGDIMQKTDPFYKWGFREDVFYLRILEYLQKKPQTPKFVYIAVSTTNHFPFVTYDKSLTLPIKNPETLPEKIKNTVYSQDQYLKTILENLKKDSKEKYIFLFSDHSWPMEYHPGNYHNESMGYRENFQIPFAFLYFGQSETKFNLKNQISKQYNEIDFTKTILDLLNIKTNDSYLGNSFYPELLKNSEIFDTKNNQENCSLSIQPYSDKYITFFYKNTHYIYDVKKSSAVYFDLAIDPTEKNPQTITKETFLRLYIDCKKDLGF